MANQNFKNVKVILNVEIQGRLEGPNKKKGDTRNNTIARRRTVMPVDFARYCISDEGRLHSIPPSEWKRMSNIKKIEAHLSRIAEGNKFTYEIIDAD